VSTIPFHSSLKPSTVSQQNSGCGNQAYCEPKGLQCHTAPFSWKLVFECDHQLYETIMTACTPKEEVEWRSRLGRQSTRDSQTQPDTPLFSSLSLNIKTMGTVFGKPGVFTSWG